MPLPIGLAVDSASQLPDRAMRMISDKYPFAGLAAYYNDVNFYIADKDQIARALPQHEYVLNDNQYFIARGRFKSFSLACPGATVRIFENKFELAFSDCGENQNAHIVTNSSLDELSPELGAIRYIHLGFLGGLAELIEWSLVSLHETGIGSWGATVIVFAVVWKVLLIPLGVLTVRAQARVSQVNAELAPILENIKQNHDGEQAHNKIMAAHKSLGVSAFYTLRPLATSLIQVPILVAIFNVLGAMPHFDGASFFWISNLAYPDSIGVLSSSIPFIGNKVSLLPLIMTAVTVFSAIIFQNPYASAREIRSLRRNLYLMAGAFLILFYPFPAVMVLYWTSANISQAIQQQFIKS